MTDSDIQQVITSLSSDCPLWTSNVLACGLLCISESTRKRDTRLLIGLGVLPEKTKRYGYDKNEFLALSVFRWLQQETDRDTAAETIVQYF